MSLNRVSLVMVVYAIVLLGGGLVAFLTAPPQANAATALIVPGACAVVILLCAFWSALIGKSRVLGMIGIHAGLVFTLVFAAAFASRGMAASGAVADYQNRDAILAEGGEAPDHDKSYLANTLWTLTGLSVVAFGAMLAMRPKPEKRGGGDGGGGSQGAVA